MFDIQFEYLLLKYEFKLNIPNIQTEENNTGEHYPHVQSKWQQLYGDDLLLPEIVANHYYCIDRDTRGGT